MRNALVAATVLATACAGYVRDVKPTKLTVSASGAALYRASLRALSDMGRTAETHDADAGLVVSEWEGEEGVLTFSRYRFRIAVDDNSLSVVSDCQEREKHEGAGWAPCGSQPKERLSAVVVLANAIADKAENAPAPADSKTGEESTPEPPPAPTAAAIPAAH